MTRASSFAVFRGGSSLLLRPPRTTSKTSSLLSLLSPSISKRSLHRVAGRASDQPLNRLSGRTCMVTGGSSGIGYAIAERFLQEGADRIILVGRSYERLAKTALQLDSTVVPPNDSNSVATRAPEEDQSPGIPPTLQKAGTLVESSGRLSLLVGDISEAGTWLRELENTMKSVDVLVNAAGVSISGVLPKLDPADISAILRTNLEGSILTSRALIRASIRNQTKRNRSTPNATPTDTSSSALSSNLPSKCIINISSLLALKAGTGAVPYAASKAGILGLTRSLTVETAKYLKHGIIRSNAIIPGYIETPMIADFTPQETARLKEEIPLHRFGQPHEIADAAVFLALNEYANNCVINLDGGLSAI